MCHEVVKLRALICHILIFASSSFSFTSLHRVLPSFVLIFIYIFFRQFPAMDFFVITVITVLFTIVLAHALSNSRRIINRGKKLPPGPFPLPIIGNLHNLRDQLHKSLAELAKTYGPIMTIKLGQVTTVVISSPAMAMEVLQKQDLAFSSRFITDAVCAHDQHKFSTVLLPVGPRWRNFRKILNSNIFSGNRLDAHQFLRIRKVEELIAYCRQKSVANEPVDINRAAFGTSFNIISNILLSKDLTNLSSDSMKEFKSLISNIFEEAGKPNLADCFPVLKTIDPQGIRRRMNFYLAKLIEVFNGLIDERLESRKLNKNGSNNDVLDSLLTISEENPENIDIKSIQRLFIDLFGAGTDTISSTVEWAMTEVLRNPQAMNKAKAEFEQIIGRGKLIQESDIVNLPYLKCIVKETLRMHPPAPFLIPRRAEADTEICNFVIPKGSQILVNAWAIGRDSRVWENPLAFIPERFLDSDVDLRGSHFELIPFGAGRRICPGLGLAIRMVPMIVGSLINSFDWKIEPKELDLEEKIGITLQKAHPLRAVPILL